MLKCWWWSHKIFCLKQFNIISSSLLSCLLKLSTCWFTKVMRLNVKTCLKSENTPSFTFRTSFRYIRQGNRSSQWRRRQHLTVLVAAVTKRREGGGGVCDKDKSEYPSGFKRRARFLLLEHNMELLLVVQQKNKEKPSPRLLAYYGSWVNHQLNISIGHRQPKYRHMKEAGLVLFHSN